MPGPFATFVATYDDSQPTSMVLSRSAVSAALSDASDNGNRSDVMAAFTEAYRTQYGINLGREALHWSGLSLDEVEKPTSQPTGCTCDCKTCDDQGWHCHKPENGCYN